jgi:hypothetical protein
MVFFLFSAFWVLALVEMNAHPPRENSKEDYGQLEVICILRPTLHSLLLPACRLLPRGG